jgi:hypothetical protein
MHVLNVVQCAKALVAAVTRIGFQKAMENTPDINEELRVLFEETSKLQVYEARARARGTLVALDETQMAEAIRDVRKRRTLTIGEEETLAATPEQVEESFSLEAPEGAPAQTAADEAPASGERKPEDSFSL